MGRRGDAIPSRRRRRRAGTGFILLGILLLLGAAGLISYNYIESEEAGEASQAIAEELVARLREQGKAPLAEEFLLPDAQGREMAVEEIDGNRYIGLLEVPSLGLSLPVMLDWDYARLRISPCRYSGSYYDDDLVICGHNYARHFSPIRGISLGADVYFTTVEGETIHYVVSNVETVQPTAISQMVDNARNSDLMNVWDMTLFTCNLGGQTRCAVRCVRVR